MNWFRRRCGVAAVSLACGWPAISQAQASVCAAAGDDCIPPGVLEISVMAATQDSGSPLASPTAVRYPGARTAIGIASVNVAMWGFNRAYRKQEWTRVSPASWWQNLKGGWEWDNNDGLTNNFHHPYHGSIYFNLARANGLSFWTAAPATVGGSLMWEIMMEAQPPSINDLLTTSLMGVVLGEATRRLSLLVLDNEASGIDRAWRELSVLLIDPGLGLNRLSRGESWQRRANPAEHKAAALESRIVVGGQRLRGAAGVAVDQALVGIGIEYGDPFSASRVQPFSFFTFGAVLASGSASPLAELDVRGILTRFGLRGRTHAAGIFMEYGYQSNPLYKFAYQSFSGGLLSRTQVGRWSLRSDLSLLVLPIVATSDDRAWASVSRLYDYGAGVGVRALGRLQHGSGGITLSAGYRAFWTATMSGGSQAHLNQIIDVDGLVPVLGRVSMGASLQVYVQSSRYQGGMTSSNTVPRLAVFLSARQ